MSDDFVQSAIAALRERGDETADRIDRTVETRLRIRRSLDERGRSHVRLVRFGTVMGLLLASGLAWGLATGSIARALHLAPNESTSEAVPVLEEMPTVPMALPEQQRGVTASTTSPTNAMANDASVIGVTIEPMAMAVVPAPEPEYVPLPTPPVPPAVEPRVARPRSEAARPEKPEKLYRTAHELHFRKQDWASALVAWDTYLAAEPNGRFAIEARYNRALTLVRLRHYKEARTALEPFANGEIGYRVDEAKQIVERLAPLAP